MKQRSVVKSGVFAGINPIENIGALVISFMQTTTR
jgi:hypothetical protein